MSRLKICVNFISQSNLISFYTDMITDSYLLTRINNVVSILNQTNTKIDYAYFQRSNYCLDYGILFSSLPPILDKLKEDYNLKVIAYNPINPIYLTIEKRLNYLQYDFIYATLLTTFIQVNPDTSTKLHQKVEKMIIKNINFYGLGGEIGIYSKRFKNKFSTTKCITNCKSICEDYQYNVDNSCLLVDYEKVNLSDIFTDSKNSTLLVNISRNGLRGLVKQVLNLDFPQIVYIGCDLKAVQRDIEILQVKYKVNINIIDNLYLVEFTS